MAQFILGQGPVEPARLYGALVNAGLAVDPAVSVSILCAAGGWSDIHRVAVVRSAQELAFASHPQTRMFLMTWSGGDISTTTSGGQLVAMTGELRPITAQGFLEEIPSEQRAAFNDRGDLLASWYEGRSWINRLIGDLSSVSAEEAAQLEASRGTQVMFKARLVDRFFREDLAPCFAGSRFAGAFIAKREREARVIVSGGHPIARCSLGASSFITTSPKLARTFAPGCLARTPQEPELLTLRAPS